MYKGDIGRYKEENLAHIEVWLVKVLWHSEQELLCHIVVKHWNLFVAFSCLDIAFTLRNTHYSLQTHPKLCSVTKPLGEI